MKRKCVFFLLLLLALTSVCSIHVSASDCIYTVSGNHLTPLCDTDISVSKEILTISLHDDGYAYVDVYYELQNDGLEKNQTVGFENQPLNYDVSPNIMMSILSKKLKSDQLLFWEFYWATLHRKPAMETEFKELHDAWKRQYPQEMERMTIAFDNFCSESRFLD